MRGEVIALEAPGLPPEELSMDPERYDDMLWNCLGGRRSRGANDPSQSLPLKEVFW